jgi:ABC-type cobalamin/Fe3+-siderophores transport system ATPase subunit
MKNFFIERVQIEGGFLDGLDASLKNGLNTIIGARGTGKSTFVELIRYCLGIKGHTTDSQAKAIGHARSVLKDGQIIVTLSDGVESIRYSRTAEGETTPPIYNVPKLPLIFSQTEIENIGLVSSGRLKIIDGFVDGLSDLKSQELSAIALIESYSSEILSLTYMINDSEDKLLQLPFLKQQLKALELEEKKISEVSKQAAQKSVQLKKLEEDYSEHSAIMNYINEYLKSQVEWKLELNNSLDKAKKTSNWHYSSEDPLLEVIQLKHEAIKKVEEALLKIQVAEEKAVDKITTSESSISSIAHQGQILRSEVDKLQKGSGEISRKCQKLRNDISQLEAVVLTTTEKKQQIYSLRQERNNVLIQLELVRTKRSQKRSIVCSELSSVLRPKIRVSIEEASQLEDYQQELINALKGSGIKYNELAPIIAETIPPRALLDIIENNNADEFISLVSISKERAFRVISSLKLSVDKIATVSLEDEIKFELLDGCDFKDFSELSTGQRCTVILPLVLEHKDTVLIVDQPEDHIDNAFIVETLISAIVRRSGQGQVIVTTHNANVPVLGNASEVIHLNSDGTRGYIVSEGTLDNPEIIEAISKVMEGGRDAFRRRASFYEQ